MFLQNCDRDTHRLLVVYGVESSMAEIIPLTGRNSASFGIYQQENINVSLL